MDGCIWAVEHDIDLEEYPAHRDAGWTHINIEQKAFHYVPREEYGGEKTWWYLGPVDENEWYHYLEPTPNPWNDIELGVAAAQKACSELGVDCDIEAYRTARGSGSSHEVSLAQIGIILVSDNMHIHRPPT